MKSLPLTEECFIPADNSKGTTSQTRGLRAGKKKRHKKTNTKISVVKPEDKENKGVASGKGKLKIATLNINDHRTYYMAANKYRLYVNSPSDYENVYIRYFAGREDNRQDALYIKNIKTENSPLTYINSEKAGPISLKKGSNVIYIEFNTNEIMALIPVFTVEVQND